VSELRRPAREQRFPPAHTLDLSDHLLDLSDHLLDLSDHLLDLSDHLLDLSDHLLGLSLSTGRRGRRHDPT